MVSKQDWLRELDKLPAKKGMDYGARFDAHKKHQAQKQKERLDELEREKNEKEAQEALKRANEEKERVTKVKLEDATKKLEKRRQAIARRENEEYQLRKEKALAWVDKKQQEALQRALRNQGYTTGQASIETLCKRWKIPYPLASWFDGQFYIKEQYKEIYDVEKQR